MFFLLYTIIFGGFLTEMLIQPRIKITKNKKLVYYYNSEDTRKQKTIIEL
jgi:hypothetical protein